MALNLVKLSVGTESVETLEDWIARRMSQAKTSGLGERYWHTTRMVPKRRGELLAGGSVYWVIKGMIQCRQKLVDIETFRDEDGVQRCRLVMQPELVRTIPMPKRPFQGWRYLQDKDAPVDLGSGSGASMPVELQMELADLGLL